MKSLEVWKPIATGRRSGPDLPEATARVLAHADGNTPVAEISKRTGLEVSDVLTALGELIGSGALEGRDAPPEIVQLAHVRSRAPSDVAPAPLEAQAPHASSDDVADLPELEVVGVPTDEDLAELPELELVDDVPDEGAGVEAAPESEAPAAPDAAARGSYRQIFETSLRQLDVDAREAWARTADGDVLCALCMDPMPGVIQAVLENPNANLAHARLIAEHHRNPVGLDTLGHRSEYLRDSTVRRLLMRNQQAPERLLVRMLGALPLPQVFRANAGHELTDRARRVGRAVLRRKFDQAESEQKVGLIVQTEGRCLATLVGLTFDQKTTALLCRRTYQSTMLIQSLARFPATPPTLIAHLLKQQTVVRNAHVKKRLQQHPNCPKYLKR